MPVTMSQINIPDLKKSVIMGGGMRKGEGQKMEGNRNAHFLSVTDVLSSGCGNSNINILNE